MYTMSQLKMLIQLVLSYSNIFVTVFVVNLNLIGATVILLSDSLLHQ